MPVETNVKDVSSAPVIPVEQDYFGFFSHPQYYLHLADFYELENFDIMDDEEYAGQLNEAMENLIADGDLSDSAIKEIREWQAKTFGGNNSDATQETANGEDKFDAFYRELLEEAERKAEDGTSTAQ